VTAPVEIALPFVGRWLAMNSPARRVPSHGVDLLGQRYAIDFVGVDDRHRDAVRSDWRTLLHTEPPERFYSFGRPILAPADGVVVAVHDGEPDHEARRSQFALVPYALGQAARVRLGAAAVAGNHVVLALRESGAFAALVHLRSGSLRVSVGDTVVTGQQLGECGNSGNSTQPHVHVQLMDSADLAVARGVPLVFRGYREWSRGTRHPTRVERGIPGERSVVEPV
jgi:hypothetical protein